jgi:hypothetical protein
MNTGIRNRWRSTGRPARSLNRLRMPILELLHSQGDLVTAAFDLGAAAVGRFTLPVSIQVIRRC